MTEHLPECLVPDFDKGLWICICNQLRACEQRVFALHPEWTMTGLCKPDCAACRRLTELITEWEYGYKKGLDAAREAVAEFAPSVWIGLIKRSDAVLVIDALRKDAQ